MERLTNLFRTCKSARTRISYLRYSIGIVAHVDDLKADTLKNVMDNTI